MQLYPAIDIKGGHCVRLYQGDFSQETRYGDDPVAQAQRFADAGASWIHVVDLDAARTGVASNLAHIASICREVNVQVQAGGGVRDMARAEALLATGVARIVVGTAALEDPAFVRHLAGEHPGKIAVGLDARFHAGATPQADEWEVAVHGWAERSGRKLVDTAKEFEDRGVAALVVTEIGRDGTLTGPDVDGLARVLAATSMDVIASGGVGKLDDLHTLDQLERGGRRLSGVIVGKALYEKKFGVADALAALAQ